MSKHSALQADIQVFKREKVRQDQNKIHVTVNNSISRLGSSRQPATVILEG